jgi:peroxiredoxin
VAKFTALNAEVIGISADAPDRNLAWTKELNLPVRLLSDVAGEVGRRYGVWDDLWSIERRTTFIVDRQGKVRWLEAGSACIDTSRTLQAVTQLKSEADRGR